MGSLVLAVFTMIFAAMGYGVLEIRKVRDKVRDLEQKVDTMEAQDALTGRLESTFEKLGQMSLEEIGESNGGDTEETQARVEEFEKDEAPDEEPL